jgi:Recombination endonuclease VII
MSERTKECALCKTVKPWGDFYLRTDRATPRSKCKTCSVSRAQRWKFRNPERYKQSLRNLIASRRLAKESLLGPAERCEICGHKFDGEGRWGPQFDHHHGTGASRGWLCNGCNRALGWLGDNPAIVKAAHEYLLKHGFDLKRPRIS